MFPVNGPFPRGLSELRWVSMNVIPGASLVWVLLLGGGCGGMIGVGGVMLVYRYWVSCIGSWFLFLLGEVG